MRKNYLRRNTGNIVLIIIGVVFSIFALRESLIKDTIEASTHLSILTVNSIFAGFLFTSLGIMLSIADKPVIAKLDRAGYMDNYYNSIYLGLSLHTISIVISLLFAFKIFDKYLLRIDFGEHIISIATITEQLTFCLGILFFVKSVINILKLTLKVRKEIIKKA